MTLTPLYDLKWRLGHSLKQGGGEGGGVVINYCTSNYSFSTCVAQTYHVLAVTETHYSTLIFVYVLPEAECSHSLYLFYHPH